MLMNPRIESLHKGDQGCAWQTGLLDYSIMTWELDRIIWVNELRKKEKFHVSTHLRIPFLAFLRHNNTTMNFFSPSIESLSVVCLETHHMLEQSIHEFAMSNSVKFFSLSMLEEEISSERISLAQQLFSLVVWTLTKRKKSCLVSFLRSFLYPIHYFHCCWQIECEVEELKCNIAEHRKSAKSQNQKN